MNPFELKPYCLACLLLLIVTGLHAQTDSSRSIKLSGYAEFYYSFDFSQPSQKEKEAIFYNHKRNHTLQANLLMLKGTYSSKRMRANVGIMSGNYSRYNLSQEPRLLRAAYEFNLGVRLSRKHKLWADIGIFPSHIGFESAIGFSCPTLTRSMVAENSPYYESGLNLNFTSEKEKWMLSLWLLNGWQRIHLSKDAQKPSGGLQILYKPNANLTLNYSNFWGSARADSLNSFRTYHNLYALYRSCSKLETTIGFDLGTENGAVVSNGIWLTPVVIIRYFPTPDFRMAMRGEYFHDPKQIIINAPNIRGFQMFGLSVNADYQIRSLLLLRVEGKWLHAVQPYFENGPNKYMLTGCLAFKL